MAGYYYWQGVLSQIGSHEIPEPIQTRVLTHWGWLTQKQIDEALPAIGAVILSGPTESPEYPGFFWCEVQWTGSASPQYLWQDTDPGCNLFAYAVNSDDAIVTGDADVYRDGGTGVIIQSGNTPDKKLWFGDDYLFNGSHCRILKNTANSSHLVVLQMYDIDGSATWYICVELDSAGNVVSVYEQPGSVGTIYDVTDILSDGITTTVIYDDQLGIGAGLVEQVSNYETITKMISDPDGVAMTLESGVSIKLTKDIHDIVSTISSDPDEMLQTINGICKLVPA